MARKRLKRPSVGLFDVPARRSEDDEVGVLGGPAGDSGMLGDAGHSSGLFDVPAGAPAEMPGLFDKPRRTVSDDSGLSGTRRQAAVAGLFDKPSPRRKHSRE